MGIDSGYASLTRTPGYDQTPKLSAEDKSALSSALALLNDGSREEVEVKLLGLGLTKHTYLLKKKCEGEVTVQRKSYNFLLRIFRVKAEVITKKNCKVSYHKAFGITTNLIYQSCNPDFKSVTTTAQPALGYSINQNDMGLAFPAQAVAATVMIENTNQSSAFENQTDVDVARNLWTDESREERSVYAELTRLSPKKAWGVFIALCDISQKTENHNQKRNAYTADLFLGNCFLMLINHFNISQLVEQIESGDAITNTKFFEILRSNTLWSNNFARHYLACLIVNIPRDNLPEFLNAFSNENDCDFKRLIKELSCLDVVLYGKYLSTRKSHLQDESDESEQLKVSTNLHEKAIKAFECIPSHELVESFLETQTFNLNDQLVILLKQLKPESVCKFFFDLQAGNCCILIPRMLVVMAKSVSSEHDVTYNLSQERLEQLPGYNKWLVGTKKIQSWAFSQALSDPSVNLSENESVKQLLEVARKNSMSDAEIVDEQTKIESSKSDAHSHTVKQMSSNADLVDFHKSPRIPIDLSQKKRTRTLTLESHGQCWSQRRELTRSCQGTNRLLESHRQSVTQHNSTSVAKPLSVIEEPVTLPIDMVQVSEDALAATDLDSFKTSLKNFEKLASERLSEFKGNCVKLGLLKLYYQKLVCKYYELHIETQYYIETKEPLDTTQKASLKYACELARLNEALRYSDNPLTFGFELPTMNSCCREVERLEIEQKLAQAKAVYDNAISEGEIIDQGVMQASNQGNEEKVKALNKRRLNIEPLKIRMEALQAELDSFNKTEGCNTDFIHNKAVSHCISMIRSRVLDIMVPKQTKPEEIFPKSLSLIQPYLNPKYLHGDLSDIDEAQVKKLHILSSKWFASYESIDHLMEVHAINEKDAKQLEEWSWEHLAIFLPKTHLQNVMEMLHAIPPLINVTDSDGGNKVAGAIALSERFFDHSVLTALAERYPSTFIYILTHLPIDSMTPEDIQNCYLACCGKLLYSKHIKPLLSSGNLQFAANGWLDGLHHCTEEPENDAVLKSEIKNLYTNTKGTDGDAFKQFGINLIKEPLYLAFDIEQHYMQLLVALNWMDSYLSALGTTICRPGEFATDESVQAMIRFNEIKVLQANLVYMGTEICRICMPSWDGGKNTQPIFLYFNIESGEFVVNTDTFQPRSNFLLRKRAEAAAA